MTERQLRVANIAGGTLIALFIVIALFAALGFLPAQPITNTQIPTI